MSSTLIDSNITTVEVNGLTELDKGLSDALTLSNQQLNRRLKELDDNVKILNNEIQGRKTIATTLKIIVVISGVLIATGFLNRWNAVIQIIGGFISLITAVERIFANVDVLLIKVAARDAYSRVKRQVVNTHEFQIIEIIQKKVGLPKEAGEKLLTMQSELVNQISKVDNEIKTSISNKQYDLLGTLTLEDKK